MNETIVQPAKENLGTGQRVDGHLILAGYPSSYNSQYFNSFVRQFLKQKNFDFDCHSVRRNKDNEANIYTISSRQGQIRAYPTIHVFKKSQQYSFKDIEPPFQGFAGYSQVALFKGRKESKEISFKDSSAEVWLLSGMFKELIDICPDANWDISPNNGLTRLLFDNGKKMIYQPDNYHTFADAMGVVL